MKSQILLIDDSEAVQVAIAEVLMAGDYLLTTASTGAEGLSYVQRQHYHLVLLDYSLPDTDGLSVLQTIVKDSPDLPVIMVTGSGSEQVAVSALKSGASDYIIKSNDFISKIPYVIRDNLEKCEMQRRNKELESQLRDSYKELQYLNKELEEKVQLRTQELERAYQLSNELMAKAVDSNMQLAELYSEVDESRRKLNAKIRELSLLNEVGKIMAATPDHDQLLKITLDSVHHELGVEHCAVLLLDETGKRLQIGASCGTPDDLLLAAKAFNGEQEILEVIRANTSLLVQDIETHEKFRLLSQAYPGLECLMVVPLRFKIHDIGALTVYGYDNRETLTQNDVEFVSSLGSQASIALTNMAFTNQRIQEEHARMIGPMIKRIMSDVKQALQRMRGYAERIDLPGGDPEQLRECARLFLEEIDQLQTTARERFEVSSAPNFRRDEVAEVTEAKPEGFVKPFGFAKPDR